jgi:hypothetical protein
VGFPAGDKQRGVCGVEGGHQHSLIGALRREGRFWMRASKPPRLPYPPHIRCPIRLSRLYLSYMVN